MAFIWTEKTVCRLLTWALSSWFSAPPTGAPPATVPPNVVQQAVPSIDLKTQLVVSVPPVDNSNGVVQAYAVLVYKVCNSQQATRGNQAPWICSKLFDCSSSIEFYVWQGLLHFFRKYYLRAHQLRYSHACSCVPVCMCSFPVIAQGTSCAHFHNLLLPLFGGQSQIHSVIAVHVVMAALCFHLSFLQLSLQIGDWRVEQLRTFTWQPVKIFIFYYFGCVFQGTDEKNVLSCCCQAMCESHVFEVTTFELYRYISSIFLHWLCPDRHAVFFPYFAAAPVPYSDFKACVACSCKPYVSRYGHPSVITTSSQAQGRSRRSSAAQVHLNQCWL